MSNENSNNNRKILLIRAVDELSLKTQIFNFNGTKNSICRKFRQTDRGNRVLPENNISR